MNLQGEVVLVTGASGNIGRGIAHRLAAAGAEVIAQCHRNRASADALIDEIGAGSVQQCDLADESAVKAMLAALSNRHCWSITPPSQDVVSIDVMSLDDWRRMHRINLDGAFLLSQRCAAAWTTAGHSGSIVNIASIEGADPAVGHAHYASSKAGLLQLTRAAALEYGAAGIRVNAVSPGLIDREGLGEDWPDGVARWRERAPLGTLGTPKDVADAVLFLLSPAARWISGTNLVVDGGMSAQSRW